MIAECKQPIATSKPSMSSVNANLSNLSLTLNSVSNTIQRSLKGEKKVEVRWLESESDLYLKQWQRRYRQLEGIDGSLNHPRLWSKSYLLEHYDDWYHTARSILDIDVQYMSSKDYNKFNLEKFNTSFDSLFLNRDKQSNFLINVEDGLEGDDDFELEDEFVPYQTITIDPNMEHSQEIIAVLKSNNLVFKNGKLEYCVKKGKNAEKEKCSSAEKQSKKAQKNASLSAADAANLSGDDSASSFPSSDASPGKCNKNSRKLTSASKLQRPRHSSNRRQMYICEYPGCSYQSDRNFNFLRHKRTHGKQKHDEIRKHHNGLLTTTSELIFAATKAPTLNDSAFSLELGSLNHDILHLTPDQSPLLASELNLNLAQCNSISLADNDQSFSLSNDGFSLERQNIIMKDMNNLDHALPDNHHFSSLSLEQPFLS